MQKCSIGRYINRYMGEMCVYCAGLLPLLTSDPHNKPPPATNTARANKRTNRLKHSRRVHLPQREQNVPTCLQKDALRRWVSCACSEAPADMPQGRPSRSINTRVVSCLRPLRKETSSLHSCFHYEYVTTLTRYFMCDGDFGIVCIK